MPFNIEFLEKAAKQMNVQSVVSDFDNAKVLLEKAVKIASKRNANINPSDVDIYLHGSYANKTNIYFPSNMEIVVELKRTPSYDPVMKPNSKYRLYNNYYVETMLDFTPSDFMGYLFDALQELTENTCTVGNKFIDIPAGRGIKHTLEVTPAFTFNYIEQSDVPQMTMPEQGIGRRTFKGILVYDRDVVSHIVTFPKLHARNGHAKDIATNGNFLKAVRMFKTINRIGMRESEFQSNRGYFIQCLLFNIPNEVYVAPDLNRLFYKVLNFLLNADFEGFASQNLVWQLFGSTNEFWKLENAHRFVRDIKWLYDNFPQSRTSLV